MTLKLRSKSQTKHQVEVSKEVNNIDNVRKRYLIQLSKSKSLVLISYKRFQQNSSRKVCSDEMAATSMDLIELGICRKEIKRWSHLAKNLCQKFDIWLKTFKNFQKKLGIFGRNYSVIDWFVHQ